MSWHKAHKQAKSQVLLTLAVAAINVDARIVKAVAPQCHRLHARGRASRGSQQMWLKRKPWISQTIVNEPALATIWWSGRKEDKPHGPPFSKGGLSGLSSVLLGTHVQPTSGLVCQYGRGAKHLSRSVGPPGKKKHQSPLLSRASKSKGVD